MSSSWGWPEFERRRLLLGARARETADDQLALDSGRWRLVFRGYSWEDEEIYHRVTETQSSEGKD